MTGVQTCALPISSGYAAGSVDVVRLKLFGGDYVGVGECSPRAYVTGQTADHVLADFASLKAGVLQFAQLKGSSAFAYNTAHINLLAQQHGQAVWQQWGIETATALKPKLTAYTLSLDTPQNMAQQAQAQADFKILKLKIDGNLDQNLQRLAAIKKARPDVSIYLDANQAISSVADLAQLVQHTAAYNVQLIEQPFVKGSVLEKTLRPHHYSTPIFADESCATMADLPFLVQHYDGVNIKLDKTGGLTHAMALAQAAQKLNLKIMVGCMGAGSLSIYPALLLANQFDVGYIDLDGAYLTADDTNYVAYYDGMVAINKNAFD